MTTKVCTRCGETKPAAAFYRDRTAPDGLRQPCKDCTSVVTAAWKARNVERIKVRNEASAERHRETSRAWYRANREHAQTRGIARRRETGHATDYWNLRRMRKQGVPVVDIVHRREVFDRAGGRCQKCGATLMFRGGDPFHVDHIIPVGPKHGGEHSYANVQALCVGCHKAKTAAEAKEKPPA